MMQAIKDKFVTCFLVSPAYHEIASKHVALVAQVAHVRLVERNLERRKTGDDVIHLPIGGSLGTVYKPLERGNSLLFVVCTSSKS